MDRGQGLWWDTNTQESPTKAGEMLAARRRHYVELVLAGMGYAEAARAVGVSKRTGKVWRNGRTRSTGRNEAPCAEWTEAAMPQPKPTGPRYLSMDERIFIADGLVLPEHVGHRLPARAQQVDRLPGGGATAIGAPWIGYTYLDDSGRTKPAFLELDWGHVPPKVKCSLKLLYQCT